MSGNEYDVDFDDKGNVIEYHQSNYTDDDFLFEPENKIDMYKLRFEIWRTIFDWTQPDNIISIEKCFEQACKLIFGEGKEEK